MSKLAIPVRLEFSRVNQALGEIGSLQDVRLGLQLPGHQKAHSGFIFFVLFLPSSVWMAKPFLKDHAWLQERATEGFLPKAL